MAGCPPCEGFSTLRTLNGSKRVTEARNDLVLHFLRFARELAERGRSGASVDGQEDLNPGGFSSNPASLVVSGNYLFFSADDGETGVEPWALRLEP